MILNNGKFNNLLNFDIRHLRPSRLDSSDGPLMVVDMNYPEYKNSSVLNQGPWRDSHAGNGQASQLVPGTVYPNDDVQYDEFSIRGNPDAPDAVFNGGILNLKMLPVPYLQDNNRGKPAASFYTVHLGMPIRPRRTYIGGGNYRLDGRGRQISHWEVNNSKGDLAEFHKHYTDPNGNNDSDQKIFVEKVLHKNYIALGTPWLSYPTKPSSSVQDIELTNSAYAYVLSHNDEVEDTGPTCGRIYRYSTDFGSAQNFGSWRSNSGTPFRVPTLITHLDSDFFNYHDEEWFIVDGGDIYQRGYAKKFRMQLGPSPNGAPSYGDDNLKVLIHCSGIGKQNDTPLSPVNLSTDWIISATMSAYNGSLTIDSEQYHFNLENHIGYMTDAHSESKQNFYTDDALEAFDIAQDGKHLTCLVGAFDGTGYILNFVLDTPWDLSTIQPWDWYDSAAGSDKSRAGYTLSRNLGTSLNNPRYRIGGSTFGDSATTYNLDGEPSDSLDWRGMTLGYAGIDWDDLADHVSAWSTIGPPALFPLNRFDSAFNQTNAFGDPLGDMDSGGYGGPGDKDADIVRRFGSNAKHLRDSESFALFGDSSRLQAKIDELIHAPINHADSGYTSIADFYDYHQVDLNPHVVYTKASSYRRGLMTGAQFLCWNHTGEYLYIGNYNGGVVQYECASLQDSNLERRVLSGDPNFLVWYGRPGL